MIIEELIARIGYDLTGEDDLKRFEKGISDATYKLKQFAKAAVATAGVAAAGLGYSIAKAAIAVGSQFENLNVQLESLEGSSDKARAALDWITDFAVKTPLQLSEVVQAYTQLRTYGLDPTDGTLQSLVDTMAMTGGGMEKLSGIIMAVGQAWTKQKLQTEEINQLLERGIPVWDLLSEATGKNVTQLQALASKGKLGRKEIQLLVGLLGYRARGASEKYSRTLEGIVSNLEDLRTMFLRKIDDAGFFQAFKNNLDSIRAKLVDLDKQGKLDAWAKGLSATFTTASNAMRGAVEGFLGLIERLDETQAKVVLGVASLLAAIGVGSLPIIGKFFGAGLALTMLSLALDDLWKHLEGGESKITDLQKALEGLGATKGVAEAAAYAIAGIGTALAIGLAIKPFATVKLAGKMLGGALNLGFKAALKGGFIFTVGKMIYDDFNSTNEQILSRSKETAKQLNGLAENSFFGKANAYLQDIGKPIRDKIIEAFNYDWSSIGRNIITSIGDGMAAAFQSVLSRITGFIDDLKAKLLSIELPSFLQGGPPVKTGRPNPMPGLAPPRSGAARSRGGPPPQRLGLRGAMEYVDPNRQLASYAGAITNRPSTNNRTVEANVNSTVTVHVAGSNASPQAIGQAASRQVAAATQRAVGIAANEPSAA